MTASAACMKSIMNHLEAFELHVRRCNGLGRTDINHEAERLFCYPLSLIYDAPFINLNLIRENYPAVDLGCAEKKVSVQVTSTNERDKIQTTLDKFFEHQLDSTFSTLIVLIIGDKKNYRSFDVPDGISLEIWDMDTLNKKVEGLSDENLEELRRYFDKQFPNAVYQSKTLHLPLVSALQATGFVGREKELADIRSSFEKGDKLVVLTGLGGMGKTELAVKFGRDYAGTVYFARFDGSFTKTLANMAVGIRPALGDEELRQPEGALCAMVLELLSKADKNDLLIIDNADSDTGSLADLQKDAGYKALMHLPLKILLTTRSETPRAVKIKAMGEEPLFEIFENHGADVDNNEKRSLIEAVKGHTLTIDLIARTLADNWVPVSTKDMLDAIANSTLSVEDFPEVGADYNQDPEQMHIYQRLRIVFQVAKIPDVEKSILRCATLLPETGLDVRYFRTALTEEMRKAFPSLGKRGWLSAENGLLTIHPVIRLVCRTELTPTDEKCGDFLHALWGQLDEKEYDRVKFAQLAEVFALAAEHLEDQEAKWINHSSRLRLDLAQYDSAKDLYEKHLPNLEERLKDTKQLATVYNNLGSIYGYLGNHSKELEYQLNALKIREKVLPPEHPHLATSYNNVGDTYSALGDHSKALEFKLKALEIREKVLPPDHPHLATSYNNVGYTYGDLGDHSKALEFLLKALKIREKVLPPEHPSLATSYNNVGSTYGKLGNHCKALEFKLKALAIREKVLPPDHPNLATSYNNVGITYAYMKDFHKAVEYLEKALEIREKVLPPTHPYIVSTKRNLVYVRSLMK